MFARANQEVALGGGFVVAAVLFPGLRRFVWRNTLGRLRSEEAILRSTEARGMSLAERIEAQANEVKKLEVCATRLCGPARWSGAGRGSLRSGGKSGGNQHVLGWGERGFCWPCSDSMP